MKTRTFRLGGFSVSMGKLVVSDPGYSLNVWCSGTLSNPVPGGWIASVEQEDHGEWGWRNSTLLAVAGGVDLSELEWEEAPFEVGVDSGMAGVWALDSFRGGDDDHWYESICDATTDNDQHAGITIGGCVSSSGFGDGGYRCEFNMTDSGMVAAVRILFLEEDDGDIQ